MKTHFTPEDITATCKRLGFWPAQTVAPEVERHQNGRKVRKDKRLTPEQKRAYETKWMRDFRSKRKKLWLKKAAEKAAC
jgi:hypothetical protein